MTNGPQVALRNAIRMLENEAATRAAWLQFPSREHDFYFGVITAARDYLHLENRAIHDEHWLARQPSAFKGGYLKASTLIGTAGDNPPEHLPLPVPG